MPSDASPSVGGGVEMIVTGGIFGLVFSAVSILFDPLFEAFALLGTLLLQLPASWVLFRNLVPVVLLSIVILTLLNIAASRALVGPVLTPFQALADALVSFFDAVADSAVSRLQSSGDETHASVEEIHREYREGEIGDVELEKRLDQVLSEKEDVETAVEVEHAE